MSSSMESYFDDIRSQCAGGSCPVSLMPKGHLYIVVGLSGAGKDTVASLLHRYTGAVNVKWAGLMKETFEKWYDLPEGSLNDHKFREQLVPGEDFSYIDVMVKAYHAWDNVDPKLTIRPTLKKICSLLDEGHDVVITDTRKVEEAEELANLFTDYTCEVLHVYGREGETRRSSDKQLENILDELGFYTEIDNSGTLEDLADKLMTNNII